MIPALRPLVEDRRFQNLILALIVLNAITLGLETCRRPCRRPAA